MHTSAANPRSPTSSGTVPGEPISEIRSVRAAAYLRCASKDRRCCRRRVTILRGPSSSSPASAPFSGVGIGCCSGATAADRCEPMASRSGRCKRSGPKRSGKRSPRSECGTSTPRACVAASPLKFKSRASRPSSRKSVDQPDWPEQRFELPSTLMGATHPGDRRC
jgi:hypothetical protein